MKFSFTKSKKDIKKYLTIDFTFNFYKRILFCIGSKKLDHRQMRFKEIK